MNNYKHLVTVLFLSVFTLMLWNFFLKNDGDKNIIDSDTQVVAQLNRQTVIEDSKGHRVKISTPEYNGSINLHGARLDDLSLVQYHETSDPGSPEVVLFAPYQAKGAYFIGLGGWLSAANEVKLPDSKTLWYSDKEELTNDSPVTLSWDNGEGLIFYVQISIDEDYLFTIKQLIKSYNHASGHFSPYAIISRILPEDYDPNQNTIAHEGFIGGIEGVLHEVPYKKVDPKSKKEYLSVPAPVWFGISDKYWLVSLIPEKNSVNNISFSDNLIGKKDRYQADFVSHKMTLMPDEYISYSYHIFAGPKILTLLDQYKKEFDLPLFDRAVDFGWLYFLTKPILIALEYINHIVHNFGVAIIILTLAIKIIMYPLANKSYISMYKMKKLQPVVNNLRERYKEDKMRFNYELMRIYKNEQINPLSGCLPLILQIPVFFALYKVLFVSIEMRNAPFFGWINNLSAPDPTSLFNGFGFLPWHAPDFLRIGALPVIMAFTMYLQQKMNPEPADPTQAKVMKFLPILFLFMFYRFPAGLVLYWTWNNILSILQQMIINKRMKGSN